MTSGFPEIKSLDTWLESNERPIVIAGPCSAESEDQVFRTIQKLSKNKKIHLIRAGIWKPRTRPNAFEGVGDEALNWLKAAGSEFNIPVTTEVANAQHAEAALKAGIDVLWIGARTTVNPFSVQEIADAIEGVDIPVMVKNPINPDLQLWIGAIERVQRAGISRIAAIHRGFSFYGDSVYRNEPRWEIPIALKTIMPDLPIFCDPSHISGRRDILQMVSQRAMDLGMEGLMIETHLDPDNALSDAQQQITPGKLKELLNTLEIRDVISPNKEFTDRLAEMRHKIDGIDRKIVELFGARMEVAKDMGLYKKENGVTILQLERWKEIVQSRGFWAKSLGLSDDFIERYLEQLHKESIRIQERSMNEGKDLDDSVMW